MQISNFSELINAKIINKSNNLRLSSFCTNLSNVTMASAFFTNSEEEAKEAINKGAYAIISTDKLKVVDEEVAYLLVDDFYHSMLRIIAFSSMNKRAILFDELGIECLKRLNISVLSNDLFKDFELILKQDLLFSSDLDYLKELSLSVSKQEYSYNIIKRSSFFYQDLILNDEYYYNVFIPVIFTEQLAKIHSIKELEINYSNLKLLDFIFLNENNEIVKMSEGSKVVFFEQNIEVIKEIKKHINLVEVSKVTNNTYMLSKISKTDFLKELNTSDEGLF
ncbi:hypothetical protein AVANS_1137 [Campylobacter sp. RM5004]|uniref:hypothetical protein n=1 Tax=Campylobacter sp. RM5004 TaxID=1660078 RepID=UPI001EFB0D4D|nr:hypothetical protein [Campylobacter sp. RM5004]ULO01757.1 hypothetical protein AVANS_1137 [Campylobacter sp. RM5004]